MRLFGLLSALAIGCLAVCAVPAIACENDPDLPILPGESVEAFNQRYDATWKDLNVVRHYEHQQSMLEQASAIYLARVVSRRELPKSGPLFEVTVKPTQTVKGTPPAGDRMLTDTLLTSCGPNGDGDATRGRVGEWVFVFEGLPKTQWRPNGYDSILVRDALTETLITAMWKVGKNPDN